MRPSLIPMLACPDCGSDIKLVQDDPSETGDIVNGMLECERCQRTFVIRRRIPQMLPRHIEPAQRQQMAVLDEQAEDYDSNIPLMVFGMAEIPYTTHLLELAPDLTLFEAGCGTGRMSEVFAPKVKQLVSVDLSFKSLAQNELRLQAARATNVHLIQADVCHLPLKAAIFDRAVSSQMIEHIPTDGLRRQAIGEVTRMVKPGSPVVISAYQYTKWSKEKDGEEEGGIPFVRFTEQELSELLQTSLMVRAISGLLVYLFVAQCVRPYG